MHAWCQIPPLLLSIILASLTRAHHVASHRPLSSPLVRFNVPQSQILSRSWRRSTVGILPPMRIPKANPASRDPIAGDATELQAYGGPSRSQRICRSLGLAIVEIEIWKASRSRSSSLCEGTGGTPGGEWSVRGQARESGDDGRGTRLTLLSNVSFPRYCTCLIREGTCTRSTADAAA